MTSWSQLEMAGHSLCSLVGDGMVIEQVQLMDVAGYHHWAQSDAIFCNTVRKIQRNTCGLADCCVLGHLYIITVVIVTIVIVIVVLLFWSVLVRFITSITWLEYNGAEEKQAYPHLLGHELLSKLSSPCLHTLRRYKCNVRRSIFVWLTGIAANIQGTALGTFQVPCLFQEHRHNMAFAGEKSL